MEVWVQGTYHREVDVSIATRLENMLAESGADYHVIVHDPAFTALEEAAATHVPGRNWAKTVVVLLDGSPALATLPATRRVDPDKLRRVTGATEVELATEEEFAELYPDCELGAMPPFGNLYGQTTFVDESLREDEHIAFHAGDHRTAIDMTYAAFEELVGPVPGDFSEPLAA